MVPKGTKNLGSITSHPSDANAPSPQTKCQIRKTRLLLPPNTCSGASRRTRVLDHRCYRAESFDRITYADNHKCTHFNNDLKGLPKDDRHYGHQHPRRRPAETGQYQIH
jgi:hypothetical protein